LDFLILLLCFNSIFTSLSIELLHVRLRLTHFYVSHHLTNTTTPRCLSRLSKRRYTTKLENLFKNHILEFLRLAVSGGDKTLTLILQAPDARSDLTL